MRNPGPYGSKVDRLGLLERVLPFTSGRSKQLCSLLKQCVRPGKWVTTWRATKHCAPDTWSRLGAWLQANHLDGEIESGGFQLIHSHSELLAYGFLPLALLRKIPLVVTFHGLPPTGVGQLSAARRRILYRHAARVIVNTEYAKALVCSLGCPPEKIVVLPQGLPLDDFPFQLRSPPASAEPLRLLTVGRYHRDKGQGYALLALRRLLDQGISACWTFVGVGPDLGRLQQLAERLALSERVTFRQGVASHELSELYRSSHLFVLPSITSPGGHVETQGVVLQEAQASGCIPIASRVGGVPECINHQQDALLVRQKSSRSIVEAVQYFLARPDEWVDYQKAGRRNVEEYYSADGIGEQMASLLKEVASGN